LFSAQAGTWTHAVNSNADLVPTVANGKVYVASNKQLQIFGLLGTPTQGHVVVPGLQPSKPDAIACPANESAIDAVRGAVRNSSMHQFSGTVCHLQNNQLQLALRSGRSIPIDISGAFTNHRQVVLSPGRTIHVRARIDAKGVAHAERISPSHTLSPLTSADR
jgi:hypothetical protein